MTEQTFTIYFDGAELDDALLDRFFEAGCDDATFGSRSGVKFAAFDRESESLGAAVAAAIEDLTKADPELRITGFESAAPVSQSTIAGEVGMSREGVRLIAAGDRGSGDFPHPLFFTGRSPLYSPARTRMWLDEHGYGCGRESDLESEIALESIGELLRFEQLRQIWTTRTSEEVWRVASALPERDFLERMLSVTGSTADQDSGD